MADGNRFKSLANKKTEDEDDGKICIEQIVADALDNVSVVIGDIIALVIAAIQPVIVKSINVAVTSAVEAATEQIMANVRREMSVIEDVGKKRSSLQVETQKLTFEIDCLEQYSRRENVRIYGLAQTQGENTNGILIDMATFGGQCLLSAGKDCWMPRLLTGLGLRS